MPTFGVLLLFLCVLRVHCGEMNLLIAEMPTADY